MKEEEYKAFQVLQTLKETQAITDKKISSVMESSETESQKIIDAKLSELTEMEKKIAETTKLIETHT